MIICSASVLACSFGITGSLWRVEVLTATPTRVAVHTKGSRNDSEMAQSLLAFLLWHLTLSAKADKESVKKEARRTAARNKGVEIA